MDNAHGFGWLVGWRWRTGRRLIGAGIGSVQLANWFDDFVSRVSKM
jgi:hypothetical protein